MRAPVMATISDWLGCGGVSESMGSKSIGSRLKPNCSNIMQAEVSGRGGVVVAACGLLIAVVEEDAG